MTKRNLLQIITEKSYRYSPTADFKLASGASSKFYFDMKMTMLDPDGIVLIAEILDEMLSQRGVKYVAGLEMGAIPLVMAACMRGHHALIVRKDKKGHGAKKLLEGPTPPVGTEVILVEDVTTTGGSVLAAVDEVRASGYKVKTVITLVDRQAGAREKLLANGIELEAIFTLDEFNVFGDLYDRKTKSTFIDKFSVGIDELPLKDQRNDEAVIAVLRQSKKFSGFEASANPTIAATMTRLCKNRLTTDNSCGYPWIVVTAIDGVAL